MKIFALTDNPLKIRPIREMELATYPCAVFACTNKGIRENPSTSALRAAWRGFRCFNPIRYPGE